MQDDKAMDRLLHCIGKSNQTKEKQEREIANSSLMIDRNRNRNRNRPRTVESKLSVGSGPWGIKMAF